MATACTTITCPTSCSDPLPPFSWDDCNPTTFTGEINRILVTNVGNPLTDETSSTEWGTRMALLDADDTKIHMIRCMAEKPEPEGDEIEIENKIKVAVERTHNITGETFQVNQTNYDAMRKYECPRKVLLWYTSASGLLWGGNVGIEATLRLKEFVPKGRKELIGFRISITWDALRSPCRTTAPF